MSPSASVYRQRHAVLICLLIALSYGCCHSVAATQELKPEQVYKQALPSVATLEVVDRSGNAISGTAFLALGEGLAVTAWHVVKDAQVVKARFQSGEETDVPGLVDKDETNDIALIRIGRSNRPVLPLQLAEPAVGSPAYVIGAPKGMDFSISDGLVSQIQVLDHLTYYQFTCPASPGNSGGPLLNAKAEVIGIVEWQMRDGQNLNFAVPARYASALNRTLATTPWTAALSARADTTDPAGPDQVLADSVKLVWDSVVAANGTCDCLGRPAFEEHTKLFPKRIVRTWKLFTPTYLFSIQRDIERQLGVLRALQLGKSQEQLRCAIVESLEDSQAVFAALVATIDSVQANEGWTPAARELSSRANELVLHSFQLVDAVKKAVPESVAARLDEDTLSALGLKDEPGLPYLGAIGFTRTPLKFTVLFNTELAFKLGFRSDDEVREFAGEKPKTMLELRRLIAAKAGSKVSAVVSRNGKTVSLRVTVPKKL